MNYRTILLTLLAYTNTIYVSAQDKPVTVSYKVNTNRSVDFNYEKNVPGTYTVILHLSKLSNCNSPDRFEQDIRGTAGKILTLTPENENQGIGFSYTYTYLRGKFNPKYQADFVYVPPYTKGTKFKVNEAGFVGEIYFGNTAPEDWKIYNFYTTKEDTVVAVRKGTVIEVKDLYSNEMQAGTAYTSKLNELYIEHPDGTIARYRGLKKGSFLVKPGQTVYPGTALAVNSNLYNREKVFTMSLAIMYLKSTDVESARQQNISNSKSLYGFVTPIFIQKKKVVLYWKKESRTPRPIRLKLFKKNTQKKS